MSELENGTVNGLIQQLETAHAVLLRVYSHYEKAKTLESQAAEAQAAFDKKKKLFYLGAIGLALTAFPLGLVGTAWLLYSLYKKKAANAAQVQELKDAAAKENLAAEQFIVDNVNTLSILPDDYWYPLASENILKFIRTGRSATIHDALDRFDALRRQWQTDQRFAEMSAAMAWQSSNLESIERSSRINTAINAGRAVADITRGVGRFFDSIG